MLDNNASFGIIIASVGRVFEIFLVIPLVLSIGKTNKFRNQRIIDFGYLKKNLQKKTGYLIFDNRDDQA
jgi:hypothetical protein